MDQNERIKHNIIKALSMNEVRQLNFHCGSRKVDFNLFNRVIDRIKSQSIHATIDPDKLDTIGAFGAEAVYDSSNHMFVFRRSHYGGHDHSEQAVIVHESVHAGFDVIGHGSNFRKIDNEPSAYLAEAFFLIYAGYAIDEIRQVLPLRLAFTIAWDMYMKKHTLMPKDDLQLLRNGVERTYVYLDLHTESDRNKTDDQNRGIPR